MVTQLNEEEIKKDFTEIEKEIVARFQAKTTIFLNRIEEMSLKVKDVFVEKIAVEEVRLQKEADKQFLEKQKAKGKPVANKKDIEPAKLSAKGQKALGKMNAKLESLKETTEGLKNLFGILDPISFGKDLSKELDSAQKDFKWVIAENDDEALQLLNEWKDALKLIQTDLDISEDDIFERTIDFEDLSEDLSAAKALVLTFEEFKKLFPGKIIDDEILWTTLIENFGDKYLSGGMGAEAILDRITNIDFDVKEKELRKLLFAKNVEVDDKGEKKEKKLSEQRRSKALKTLKIIAAFNQKDEDGKKINDPRSMVLQALPVIPPDLRPMVELDGGRFATSDQNDLYRRVINRNNRLRRLKELRAPEIIVNNEKRMLQEAVDALLDNGRRGRPVTAQGGRALKSLSDTLKGKQGRFRQNLLGKRVDYSGRSVIVVGPSLKLYQCGLPKLMALELFKPFIMKMLVDKELAANMKSAQRMLEHREAPVWDVLASVIKEHSVLLNRAPTLHRLGIQAFEPILVESKAIQIHPLVCAAFNADFDGDQMAVHVPLSTYARAEARILMLSANNILSPANGRPLVTPSKDMLVGSYYLTVSTEELAKQASVEIDISEGKESAPVDQKRDIEIAGYFRDVDSLRRALGRDQMRLHDSIEYRIPKLQNEDGSYTPTTPGRVIFNEALPEEHEFINEIVWRGTMGDVVDSLARNYSKAVVVEHLDKLKDLCFEYATKSGLTISVNDIPKSSKKQKILDEAEKQFQEAEKQFDGGVITAIERDIKEIEIWNEATNTVRVDMEGELKKDSFNSLWMMLDSGARANMTQVRQMAGMRGLMNDSNDDPIPRPIKSNLREGLSVLEYFITTIGARKGLVDVARRTPLSGYFTRRLVDVAQEVVTNWENPLESPVPPSYITIEDVTANAKGEPAKHLTTRLYGRVIAEEVKLSNKSENYPAGTLVDEEVMKVLANDPKVESVNVLSPLTDDNEHGVSPVSYGMSFATGELVEPGEAIGIIAAQSLGEASTQFTLRTFHTGGDRTDTAEVTGLERVDQLLDARKPGEPAILAPFSGRISIEEDENGEKAEVTLKSLKDDEETIVYEIANPSRSMNVNHGDQVSVGDQLTRGLIDPHDLLAIRGLRETQLHLVKEMQKVYQEQGANIHDKHIELIVRQMTRWVEVEEVGDSDFIPGDRVEIRRFRSVNRELIREKKNPAEGKPVLLGIKQAPLAGGIGRVPLGSDSWLAPASYEYVIDVLTEAAIGARKDVLRNLKENVAVGKLIPAGTGMEKYRQDIYAEVPNYQPPTSFSTDEFMEGEDEENLDQEASSTA